MKTTGTRITIRRSEKQHHYTDAILQVYDTYAMEWLALRRLYLVNLEIRYKYNPCAGSTSFTLLAAIIAVLFNFSSLLRASSLHLSERASPNSKRYLLLLYRVTGTYFVLRYCCNCWLTLRLFYAFSLTHKPTLSRCVKKEAHIIWSARLPEQTAPFL